MLIFWLTSSWNRYQSSPPLAWSLIHCALSSVSGAMLELWQHGNNVESDEEEEHMSQQPLVLFASPPPIANLTSSSVATSPPEKKYTLSGSGPLACTPKWAGHVESDDEYEATSRSQLPGALPAVRAPVEASRRSSGKAPAPKSQALPGGVGGGSAAQAAPKASNASQAKAEVKPKSGKGSQTGFHSIEFKNACAAI